MLRQIINNSCCHCESSPNKLGQKHSDESRHWERSEAIQRSVFWIAASRFALLAMTGSFSSLGAQRSNWLFRKNTLRKLCADRHSRNNVVTFFDGVHL